MNDTVAIIGGGGHASMLCGVFPELRDRDRCCYVDRLASKNRLLSHLQRFETLDEALHSNVARYVNGLGLSVPLEKRFLQSLQAESHGLLPVNLVSSSSSVFTGISNDCGVQILAHVVIQPNVKIGRHVVLNTAAVIEHDVELGDGVFVAPNSTILGGAIVERWSLIGAGAIILPEIRVGQGAIVGAGAVVTSDVGSGETVVGIPARPLVR